MVDDFRGRGGSPWGSPPGGGGNGSGRNCLLYTSDAADEE